MVLSDPTSFFYVQPLQIYFSTCVSLSDGPPSGQHSHLSWQNGQKPVGRLPHNRRNLLLASPPETAERRSRVGEGGWVRKWTKITKKFSRKDAKNANFF